MSRVAVMVGFIRPLPGVHTFATPVFLAEADEHVIQTDSNNTGRVQGFELVDVRLGFVEARSGLGLVLSDPALYAFETSEGSLSVGTARCLARHLTDKLATSRDFRAAWPRTAAAVDRFVAFSHTVEESGQAECLYEFSRPSPTQPYMPVAVTCEALIVAKAQGQPTVKRWTDEIARHITADHGASLDAHEATVFEVQSLRRRSPDRAKAFLDASEALGALCKRCKVDHGDVTLNRKPVCTRCLFRLVDAFPSFPGVMLLDRVAQLLAPIAEGDLSPPGAEPVLLSAAQFEASHFRRHGILPGYEDVFKLFSGLLERLEMNPEHGKFARETMVELGIRYDIGVYIKELQGQRFDEVVTQVTSVPRRLEEQSPL